MDVIEGRFPGPHAVQQMAPGPPVQFVELEQDGRPDRARHARPQGQPQRGERETARPNLVEHADAGQHQQDPVKTRRMSAARAGQLVALARSVDQEVGNAEFRRDVDRLRDSKARTRARSCPRASTLRLRLESRGSAMAVGILPQLASDSITICQIRESRSTRRRARERISLRIRLLQRLKFRSASAANRFFTADARRASGSRRSRAPAH